MESGASVVSANKALLAEDGATLHAAAEKHGVDLYYEAAVGGAIPLLRPLRESLSGDRIRRVLGIVSRTTNFVLDKMDGSAPGSPRRWRTPRHSASPRRTRPRTSRVSTLLPRPPSWRR